MDPMFYVLVVGIPGKYIYIFRTLHESGIFLPKISANCFRFNSRSSSGFGQSVTSQLPVLCGVLRFSSTRPVLALLLYNSNSTCLLYYIPGTW